MADADVMVMTLARELDEVTVADRIRQSTALHVQERIDDELIRNVGHFFDASAHAIAHRIAQLEREWSVERVLTLQSSATALTGLFLGLLSKRRWLLLSAVTSGFLMQHSLQGWCPPLSLHRRLGFRTQREIDLEIHMLKAIRGDYEQLPAAHSAY